VGTTSAPAIANALNATNHQLKPGSVLFEWDRAFTLWGYTGSHSVLLFRSVRDGDDGTRIDLVFKPVDAMRIQTRYRALTVRVAPEDRAAEVLAGIAGATRDDRVLELLGPDGDAGYVVCLATGCHEDNGEYWEPSPFAMDLTDGRTTLWRARVLGGGPDGEMTATYASVAEVVAAADADPPPRPTGRKGRYLFVAMARNIHADGDESRATAMAAFLTRDEAERHLEEHGGPSENRSGFRTERWVDSVPLDL
jgi:hypothetical protein